MDFAAHAMFGVAGNFTGHLEQAGESVDFVDVKAAAGAPKGMFPAYLPGVDHPLGRYPLSHDALMLPEGPANVQVEPEIALRCELGYDDGGITVVKPTHFAAWDDCSIRRPGARKISDKKNWGAGSKGASETWLPIDSFGPDGAIHHYRLACFLLRNGDCLAYGQDSAVADYSYHYDQLIGWMADKLRNQQDAGPLECLSDWLDRAGRPERALISIGATRYTDLGEVTFVKPRDETVVVTYDSRIHTRSQVTRAVATGAELPGASILRRTVRPCA
jgi:hypothetical protein